MSLISWRFFVLVLKPLHSTESALLRVFNVVLSANDSGDRMIHVLLDLTAGFDTMDNKILVSYLQHLVGICGSALEWFRSYLTDGTFMFRFCWL